MLYIGFDGTGYQTGLAKSADLLHWERVACVARRDPNSKYTRFNIALSCIVRDDGLTSKGQAEESAWPLSGRMERLSQCGL